MKSIELIGPIGLAIFAVAVAFFQIKVVPWLERRGISI